MSHTLTPCRVMIERIVFSCRALPISQPRSCAAGGGQSGLGARLHSRSADGWARLSRSVISLPDASVVMDGDVRAGNGLQHPDASRGLPFVSSRPRRPLMIPDEILDYYGWVFC